MDFIKITTFMHCVRNGWKALAEIWNVFTFTVCIACGYLRLTKSISVKFSRLCRCFYICMFSLVYFIFIRFVSVQCTCLTYAPTRHCWRYSHNAEQHQIMRKSLRFTKKSQIWNSNRLESLYMFTISILEHSTHMNYKFIILMYTLSTFAGLVQTTMYKFLVSWFFLKVIIEIRYIQNVCGLDMHTLFWLLFSSENGRR